MVGLYLPESTRSVGTVVGIQSAESVTCWTYLLAIPAIRGCLPEDLYITPTLECAVPVPVRFSQGIPWHPRWWLVRPPGSLHDRTLRRRPS